MDMSFVLSRIIHFYHLNYDEVMALPIHVFWMLSGNVNRIRAEEDLRALRIGNMAQGQGGASELAEKLVKEMGEVCKTDPRNEQRDEEGFADLKALALKF